MAMERPGSNAFEMKKNLVNAVCVICNNIDRWKRGFKRGLDGPFVTSFWFHLFQKNLKKSRRHVTNRIVDISIQDMAVSLRRGIGGAGEGGVFVGGGAP